MEQFASKRTDGRTYLALMPIMLLLPFIILAITGKSVLASSGATSESETTKQESKHTEVRELKPGVPVERELAAGERHAYRITLASSQYINVVVEQFGVNVEVELSDPAGRPVAQLDWWWREGTESLWSQTESTGDYTVKISAPTQPAETGKYRIKIQHIGEWAQASARDRDTVSAHKTFGEGEKLLRQGSAESLREATQKYQEALKLWRALKDGDAEAHTLNELGVIEFKRGNYKEAPEFLNPAIQLFRTAGNRRGEVNSLTTLTNVYNLSGETQKALENYYQALPLTRAIKDHFNEAGILAGLGLTLHRSGQTQKALATLNELVVSARANGYLDGQAVAHNNIGLIYVSQGRLREAIEHYSQTLSLLEVTGERLGRGTTLNNIGSAHARMGEFQKALEFLLQGLEIKRQTGDRRGEAFNLGSIGFLHMRLEDYPKALEYCEQSLILSRAIGSKDSESATLSNLGVIHARMGDLRKALEYFDQALTLTVQLADRNREAYVLTALGSAYGRLGEPQKALDYYHKALDLRRAVGDQYGESQTLSALGAVNAQLGNQIKALDQLNQGLALARSTGDRLGEVSTLFQLARIERGRNNFAAARSQTEAAVNIVEATRTRVSLSDARATYFASSQELYDFYIDLLMQSYKADKEGKFLAEAVRANERRSARSLLDLLTEAGADIRAGIAHDLLKRERQLQQDLNAKADQQVRLLSRTHSAEQAAGLAKEIELLASNYEQALAQIRQSSPRYANLTQPTPLSLKQIQTEVLDPDTLLLQYTLGEERSYLWAVTPTSIKSYELPRRAEIETAARRVYDLLVNKADALYPEAVASLSQTLLGPVADQLSRKRLLIVGQGALQYVPFGALPEPLAKGVRLSDHGSGRTTHISYQPLAVNHEIVSLPSTSVLAVLRRELSGRAKAGNKVIVLADPVFGKDDHRVKSGGRNQGTNGRSADEEAVVGSPSSDLQRSANDLNVSFDRLLISRSEAELITAMVPRTQSLKALDFAASRATATSPALSQYQIVHFATHSLLNNQHPELSGIVLSLVDEQGQPQDGFLRLHDIYNLNLTADLVVLSACQTALGKEVKGEGLIGLTRGFMYAGTPRVVASLWKVSDTATAELMKRFYQKMFRGGLRPAAALREAQISMMKEKQWAAPYYWAPFVLQGEWR